VKEGACEREWVSDWEKKCSCSLLFLRGKKGGKKNREQEQERERDRF